MKSSMVAQGARTRVAVAQVAVRFRLDFEAQRSIGIGKIQLLEGIAHGGSLSEAARLLRMSYRRAWLLLAELNRSFDEPVAIASTGGRHGGGMVLTALGERLAVEYRRMEVEVQRLTEKYFQEFGRRVARAAQPPGLTRADRLAKRAPAARPARAAGPQVSKPPPAATPIPAARRRRLVHSSGK